MNKEVCMCLRTVKLHVFLRKTGDCLYVSEDQDCMERPGEGLCGLGWEAEEGQPGKAAEIS